MQRIKIRLCQNILCVFSSNRYLIDMIWTEQQMYGHLTDSSPLEAEVVCSMYV